MIDRTKLAACLVAAVTVTSATALAADDPYRGEAAAAPIAAAVDPHAQAAVDPHAQAAVDPHQGHGMGQAPADGAFEDPSLPTGTLEIAILDPGGKPLPSTPVTLGVLYNSVAKGESRKRLSVTTDARGVARLDGLETGSTVAYRPMVVADGATFSVMPFRMPEGAGMRARLHVYPVTSDLDATLIVSQSAVYAEVKDDRVQIQQAFRIYNFGQTAWVPKDLVLSLPPDFTAFVTQQGMSDVGVEAIPGKGVRLQGTFGPGQHMVEFRWQLPYSGSSTVRFDVGMPPHTAASRVLAPASREMVLEVPGFPTPESTNDGVGQRMLLTEKQVRRDEAALDRVEVIIKGLPSEGPGKIIATVLSSAAIALGLVVGTRRPGRRDRDAERKRLLSELEDLERARQAGDVGPKTYEGARREIVNALAQTYADEAPTASPARGRKRPA